MRIRLSLFCLAITTLIHFGSTNAQQVGELGGGVGGGQAAFRQVSGDLLQGPGFPGRLWFESNFADQGLGFENSYFTLGAKSRLFQDSLDGRWLIEGQVNHAIEDGGGFFANIGLERVISIEPANADISLAVFYDYDDDTQQDFSDGFHQVGFSGAIKTPHWDLIGNGYVPVSTDGFTLGDVTGGTNFVGNRIALQAGIESALEGFDVTVRMRPRQLAFANGFVDFGGYHYDSDLVESFAGGRLRTGFQLPNGLSFTAEVNQDERFDTTGFLGVGFTFGANSSGRGSEYAGLARDLEKIARNDHIVRFNQDLIVAIDPKTGQPYNVIHANNLQAGVGDGTFENPFATLVDAQDNSSISDIIFVDAGDGTDQGYDQGIVLQDHQQLLSGNQQFVQNADGTLIPVTTITGAQATISNAGGNAVVQLAKDNVVGGLTIDATLANFGILGAGNNGGIFNNNNISGAVLDGVNLQGVTGNFAFNSNVITGNGRDGVFVDGAFDPDSVFTFDNNTVSTNGRDGIHLANYNAESITLTSNTNNMNGRHGLFLENLLGLRSDINIINHTADSNGADGIQIQNGSGNLNIVNATATNNAATGLNIANWTTPLDGEVIFIGNDGTAPGTFSNNAVGINIDLIGDGQESDVVLTAANIDNNNRGVLANVSGVNTTLNLNIVDNFSIANNQIEAIRFDVSGGATINNLISNDPATPLNLTGNNILGNSTINFTLSGLVAEPTSQINSVIRNVNINTAGVGGASGIGVNGTGNSRINLDVADSTITSATGVAVSIANTAPTLVNTTFFDNVTVSANLGYNFVLAPGAATDISITNSLIQSNGILANPAVPFNRANPGAFAPFTDGLGNNAIIVTAIGGGIAGPDNTDNLTRINIANNAINDFTFDGITIASLGDAQVLLDITSNQINRNGPGLNNDPMNNDTLMGPVPPVVDVNNEFFHNGIEIAALGTSSITGRILNNSFVDNFERAIHIGTLPFLNQNILPPPPSPPFPAPPVFPPSFGTINLLLADNVFASDLGLDTMNSLMGSPAVNRINGEVGVFNSLNGNISVDFDTNTFAGFPIDVQNLGPMASVQLGLNGTTNGFLAPAVPGFFTPSPFGVTATPIALTDMTFDMAGFLTSP